MKNRFLFFFVTLFLLTTALSAQVNKYHSLVDSGNVWSNAFETSDCNGGNYYWGFHIYQVMGDSTIHNLTYRKVDEGWITATGLYYVFIASVSITPMSFNGILLRDDTVNKKVLIHGNDTDEVLYDFNLNTGDTIPEVGQPLNGDFTVAFIDSIQMDDDTYRKRWGVTGGLDTAYFIEGIGFTGGFDIPNLNEYFYAECSGSALNCFSQQDTNLYQVGVPAALQVVYDTTHFTPCQVPTTSGIYNPNLVTATLFPNPVARGSRITVKGITEEYTLTLDNVFGQQVYSKEINYPSQPITLPDFIIGGIYFCSIKTQSNLMFMEKIVVL